MSESKIVPVRNAASSPNVPSSIPECESPNEPCRTPGSAEGLEEDADFLAGMSHCEQGEAGWREHVREEPGRTPGQAEGTEEDVDRVLAEMAERQGRERGSPG
jgi:hypothetical protein